MLGGEGGGGASGGDDDIDLARDQLGRKSGQPLQFPLGIAVLDHDVAALDVAAVAQSLTEGLVQVGGSSQAGCQVAHSGDFGPLLRLILLRVGRGAHRCQPDGDAREKAAT